MISSLVGNMLCADDGFLVSGLDCWKLDGMLAIAPNVWDSFSMGLVVYYLSDIMLDFCLTSLMKRHNHGFPQPQNI